MACKKGQFDVFELMLNSQLKTYSINLNAQRVNGITPFDFSTVIRNSRVLSKQRVVILFPASNCIVSRLTSNLDVPINRTCKCSQRQEKE